MIKERLHKLGRSLTYSRIFGNLFDNGFDPDGTWPLPPFATQLELALNNLFKIKGVTLLWD